MTHGISNSEIKRLGNDLDCEEEQLFQKLKGVSTTCINIQKQILNDTSSGWKVSKMLAELKEKSIGFDFRIKYDSSNRPTGVCWMTSYMRNLWIRYGDLLFLDCKKKDMNRLYWPYIGPTIVNNENKIGVVVESLCIEESDDTYSFVLASLQDMEPRRKLSSIKVIFVDGFLNDTFATKMNMNSTVMFLDSYHLLNCIWPDSLGERAYNVAKKNLEVMVFCHDKKGYEDAFKEIKKDLQHMPEKLSCIEKRYKNPGSFAQSSLLSIRGSMRKKGSAHAEQNHASMDSHIPIIGGALEPEELIEKLIIRHDEWVAKQERIRREVMFTSQAMATKLADPTLKSAVKTLSKYSYELFQKEYGAAQKYMKESRAKNFFIDEYESLLITHDNARCSNPYCVSMNFQCRHELFASMHSVSNEKDKDVFSCLSFGSRHFQQHVYLQTQGTSSVVDTQINASEQREDSALDVEHVLESQESKPEALTDADDMNRNNDVVKMKGREPNVELYSYSDIIKEAKNLASTIQRDNAKVSAVVEFLRTLTTVAREDKANSAHNFLKLCEASLHARDNNESASNKGVRD